MKVKASLDFLSANSLREDWLSFWSCSSGHDDSRRALALKGRKHILLNPMAASVSAQCSGLQVKTYLTNSELVLYENSFQWLIITEKEVFKM